MIDHARVGKALLLPALPWLVMLSAYDIRRRRLPNWLTLPGAAVVLIFAAVAGCGLVALAGAAGLAGVYLLVHLLDPRALGAGDVKLALGLGALTSCFGVQAWVSAAVIAPLLTALWALVTLVLRGVRTVPHGPAMCAASIVGAVLGMAPTTV